MTDPLVAAAARDWLEDGALGADALAHAPAGSAAQVALLDDELSAAGEHAEGLIARAGDVLRPGGLLLVSARSRIWAEAAGNHPRSSRTFTAAELRAALAHRGFTIELLTAPGAAAVVRTSIGGEAGPLLHDAGRDRLPGLLDAAPRLLAVARAPADPTARSRAFFDALPRKIIAAGVLCRRADGQMLVVFDSYRGAWTIPGGVVDADESPRDAAVREAWEEAGVRVEAGPLLGVFAAGHPDRLHLIYAAEALAPSDPSPVHTHEIDAAAWVTVDEALRRCAPHIAHQITRCLKSPGQTWKV